MTGRGVDALLAFFFVVCGVPGTFSVCALDITLTGLQKRPVWRLHLISHTIMLPSLAPVAKMTDKETHPIQFVHYHVTEKLFSTFEAYLFHYRAEHFCKDTLTFYAIINLDQIVTRINKVTKHGK